jgi:hypothetical protein
VIGSGRRDRLLPPALLGLAAGALAACAAWPVQQSAQTAAVQSRPSSPPHAPVPHPTRKPAPPSATPEEAGSEPSSQPLAAVGPEAVPPGVGSATDAAPQARELIGLDEPAATRLLGEAAERTEQPPAAIWRYRTATCELDLYFYLDVRTGRMRTLHYAFKGDTTDARKRMNCLRELVAARNG